MPYEGEGIYRHYKGGIYEVLGIALVEATLEPCVVYKPTVELPIFMQGLGATMYTRPLEDFNAMVRDASIDHSDDQFKKPEKLPPMVDPRKPVPRFRKLSMSDILAVRNDRLTEWVRFNLEQS